MPGDGFGAYQLKIGKQLLGSAVESLLMQPARKLWQRGGGEDGSSRHRDQTLNQGEALLLALNNSGGRGTQCHGGLGLLLTERHCRKCDVFARPQEVGFRSILARAPGRGDRSR